MDPRGSARFCGRCDKVVHDLSALGEKKARALLESTPQSLCVRYLHDASGEIYFGSQELVSPARLARGKRNLMAAVVMAAAPVLFQACGGADPYGDEDFRDVDAGRAEAQNEVEGDADPANEAAPANEADPEGQPAGDAGVEEDTAAEPGGPEGDADAGPGDADAGPGDGR